ncbi:MAG: HAD family phosphatase [Atopobiaceae bacterium]|nr:HAD family phosphatase [Atopobiaceae bacterium]
MCMIRLALADIDSTLIPYGRPMASSASIAGVRAANRAGILAGPITGRTTGRMRKMFGDASDCWDTGVLVNGQVVRLGGQTILQEAPSRDTLEEVARIVRDFAGEGCALTVYDDEVDGHDVCVGITREEMRRYPKAFAQFRHCAPHVPEGVFLKTNVHLSVGREDAIRLRDELQRRVPELTFVFPFPTSPTIDITPAGITKLTGLRLLVDELRIGWDEVCVFGDGENDLPVIRAVPNSVAVLNADPEVARAARWHIGADVDDAVAGALLALAHGEWPFSE